MSDVERDIEQLTDRVIDQLEPGYYSGKLVLSRRQAVTLGISASALVALGFGEAEAQTAAGQVGTDAERVDVWAAGGGNVALDGEVPSVSSTSTASGYDLTIEGDTYQFNE